MISVGLRRKWRFTYLGLKYLICEEDNRLVPMKSYNFYIGPIHIEITTRYTW
jgi:hypothetical protein